MNLRSNKARIILAVVAVCIVVVAVVGYFMVRTVQHNNAVDEADKAASDFASARKAYDADSSEAVDSASGLVIDYSALASAVDEQIKKAPKVKELHGYGPQHSVAYQKAREQQPALTDQLENLKMLTTQGIKADVFVTAATKALADPTVLGPGSGVLRNGDPLRQQIIKPIRKRLATYRKTSVPPDAKSAHKQVVAALDGLIKQAQTAATNLDRGHSAQVQYGRGYSAALRAVQKVRMSIRTKVIEAISTIGGRSSPNTKAA